MGLTRYAPVWEEMRTFTLQREPTTSDEIWLTEHLPVYTLGLAGDPEHRLRDNGIPLVNVDRGGQITYHGPGQIVVYPLLDLKRRDLRVRELVARMEQSAIDLLADYGLTGAIRPGAPGVYVSGAKIASLGLRVRRGCCYHGLALNVDMDLAPFLAINPCGYPGLAVTQMRDLGVDDSLDAIQENLLAHLLARLGDTSSELWPCPAKN
jgi:lipoyl(octanoyl) transferase